MPSNIFKRLTDVYKKVIFKNDTSELLPNIKEDTYPTFHVRYHGNLDATNVITIPENVTLMIPYCCGFINTETTVQALDLGFNSKYYREVSDNIITAQGKKYIKLQSGMTVCDTTIMIQKHIGTHIIGMMNNEELVHHVINMYSYFNGKKLALTEVTLKLAMQLDVIYLEQNKKGELKNFLHRKKEENTLDISQNESLLPNHVVHYNLLYFCGQKYFDNNYTPDVDVEHLLTWCLIQVVDQLFSATESESESFLTYLCKFLLKDGTTWKHPFVKLEDYPIDMFKIDSQKYLEPNFNFNEIIRKLNFLNIHCKNDFFQLFHLQTIPTLERKFYNDVVIPRHQDGVIRLSHIVDFLHAEYPSGVFIINISCQSLTGDENICMVASCLDKALRAELKDYKYRLTRKIFVQEDMSKLCEVLAMYPETLDIRTPIDKMLSQLLNVTCSQAMTIAFIIQIKKKYNKLYHYLIHHGKHMGGISLGVVTTIINDYITDKYMEEPNADKKQQIKGLMGELVTLS